MQSVFGFEGKAFIMSQLRQRECLDTVTGMDWSKIDAEKIGQAVGKMVNPRPLSYSHPHGLLVDSE